MSIFSKYLKKAEKVVGTANVFESFDMVADIAKVIKSLLAGGGMTEWVTLRPSYNGIKFEITIKVVGKD